MGHHKNGRTGPRGRKDRVTIHAVAELAGVSTSTTSRTINGSGPVSKDSARIVWEAIHTLGYAPDPAAQALALRRSRRR